MRAALALHVRRVAAPRRRQSQAVPTASSPITHSSATRGPRPMLRASKMVTIGAVTIGATTCGSAAARFQTPIARAIASRGITLYAIAQSAV